LEAGDARPRVRRRTKGADRSLEGDGARVDGTGAERAARTPTPRAAACGVGADESRTSEGRARAEGGDDLRRTTGPHGRRVGKGGRARPRPDDGECDALRAERNEDRDGFTGAAHEDRRALG